MCLASHCFLHIGNAKNELPLVGVEAGSLRVCDATGNEMLYRISDPNGETVASGPIPQGSELSIPVECKAEITCKYYVYFDNPRAMPSPEFLKGKGRLANSDIEKGSDRTPFGWEQDQGDPTHQVEWSREESHSGQHSLKTTVAEKRPSRRGLQLARMAFTFSRELATNFVLGSKASQPKEPSAGICISGMRRSPKCAT